MKWTVLLAVVLVSVTLFVACAPASAPNAPPAPTAVPTAASVSNVSPLSSPDAWGKVVEAARNERVVTIYSFYYVGDIGRAIAKAFQEKYGVRVEILAAPGRQTVEKVKVEQQVKQPVADVVNTGVSSATELSLAGLGESAARELPSLKDKSVFLVDPVYSPNGDMLFVALTLIGPAVNTNLVNPQEEPRSFADFLDPKWKGHILSVDPRAGGGGLFTTMTVMKYFQVLDDDYWRKLTPQLKLFGGSQQEQYRMVARGEYKIAMPGSDTPLAPLIAEGAPMKLLPMEEGTVAQGESIMAIKGAPHPNAAKLFMDWALSVEGQTVYARAASLNSMRKDVAGFLAAGAAIKPKKILNRSWEAAQAGNDYQKAGWMEQIFGKR